MILVIQVKVSFGSNSIQCKYIFYFGSNSILFMFFILHGPTLSFHFTFFSVPGCTCTSNSMQKQKWAVGRLSLDTYQNFVASSHLSNAFILIHSFLLYFEIRGIGFVFPLCVSLPGTGTEENGIRISRMEKWRPAL